MLSRRSFCTGAASTLVNTIARADVAPTVDALLVLAIDASGSVDYEEWDMCMRGYAEALTHADVLSAIRGGMIGAIGVSVFRWGHPAHQELRIPWTLIDGEESARSVATHMRSWARRGLGCTSISAAITYGEHLIERAPFRAIRKVIDVSGDGFDNTSYMRGPSDAIFKSSYIPPRSVIAIRDTELLHATRDSAVLRGITINGLPITVDIPWLDDYYQDSVVGGPGAFVFPTNNFESFGTAVRKKIVIEIS
jgi:hypothetical protein